MNGEQLAHELKSLIKGDAVYDVESLERVSRDKSIFQVTPMLVVYPKDATDVSIVVRFVKMKKEAGQDIGIAARSAGTDMSGGPLTTGVVLDFSRYMNACVGIDGEIATVQPGLLYRDLDAKTRERGLFLPSFPASREICGLGGMFANNAGGELNLRYGKTDRYVRSLGATLSDGSTAEFRKLSFAELETKKNENYLESKIYRDLHRLISENKEEIERARPNVSKNSSGYALWDVLDEASGTFDLTKLIVGSQGTLCMIDEAKIALVAPKKEKALVVAYAKRLNDVPELVRRLLRENPESLESYDGHMITLALRFFPRLFKQLGFWRMCALALSFVPEMWMTLSGGLPALVVMAEFGEETHEAALQRAHAAQWALRDMHLPTEIYASEIAAKKFWTVRRESFSLLRKNPHGLFACPFIEDIVVHPDRLPEFLPRLIRILDRAKLTYAITGHVGDGNLHIIPLIDLRDETMRTKIIELAAQVYALVGEFRGSNSGEHNDGIIRTPFLDKQFSPKMLELFSETKRIFDPQGIFNPGKKVGGTVTDIRRHMIRY